jgi:hypothetical protein
MDWQPIETAPKDERYVLLWNDETVGIGWWDRREWCWNGECFVCVPQPTHWMPLPALT